MKRLLFAPLLLGLLITNSVLAGRPDPKKKLIQQQQEEYITTCNNFEKNPFLSCNKIIKSNRNKITNQKFINTKKNEAREYLGFCIIDNLGSVCTKLRMNLSRVDWIEDEITPEDVSLINKYAKQYFDNLQKKGKEAEKFLKESMEQKNKVDQLKKQRIRFCENLIKENLKDPSSYRRINSRYNQIATGYIRYSATNSFGGRVQESFKCFDP